MSEIQLPLLAGCGPAPDHPAGSSDEFYTPTSWHSTWNAEAGGFTVDACATLESRKCQRYYDYHQDGRAQRYDEELVWCNPPYSDIAPWVELAWNAMHDGARGWWMLLPNWSDRAWWQAEVEPFRDVGPGLLRASYDKAGRPVKGRAPRPWASLETRTLPRIRFGFPGDPEGVSPKALSDGAKIYPVLLIWRPGMMRELFRAKPLRQEKPGP